MDGAGNLYIADWLNYRIRRVSPAGIITTVAGNGIYGFSGDGGPAVNASLGEVYSVAVDSVGNLYIAVFADFFNYNIRKVSPDGIISTFAGGLYPRSVAVDATGNVYVADRNRISKVSPNGKFTTVAGEGSRPPVDGQPATGVQLGDLHAVGVDSAGNVFMGDTDSYRIRKVDSRGILTSVAGNGLFKFSGDGGPASSASLNTASGVAVNSAGNVYVADKDSHRVRMVSPQGTITTTSGNGTVGSSGDGGPATSASLFRPKGLAEDTLGNLYIADIVSVRKVSPEGIITTVVRGNSWDVALDGAGGLYIANVSPPYIFKLVRGGANIAAGNGVAGFSGDGGPATSASLNFPLGIALDAAGNLYIAEQGNHRIRKVSPDGIINSVVGNGVARFSGDGGPATSASLNAPSSVKVDTIGNIYIADSHNSRIRQAGLDGIIITLAGGGRVSPGDGLPGTSVLLPAAGLALDTFGNLYIASNDRIRKVWATTPGFAVSPAGLRFRAPAGDPVVAEQQISVLSEAVGLQWSAVATTQSGGNWLSVTPAAGQAPGVIAVSVSVADLEPGTYSGTVTVNAPLANPTSRTVAVTLTVEAAIAPKLMAEPLALTFEAQTGVTSLPAKTLRISNGGSATIAWTARVETTSGGQWLEIAPSSGSVTSSAPQTVQVRAVPGNLAAGVYTGSVRLASATTGRTETIPVTLLIAQPTKTVLVSQTGLLFTGVESGGATPSQTFGIANIGEGEMIWTIEATTLSGGANWLSVSPREGRSDAGSLRIPQVEVSVNSAGLRSGQYNGLLRINALGASNSPQFVTVTLNMLPPGSNPGVVVRPTGMIFAAQAGRFSPGSQTVRLSTAASGQIEARSGLFTFGGGYWIEILPPNVALSADDPRTIVVQPNLGSFAPGVYRGQLAFAFSDGSPTQRVGILFLVVAGAVGAGILSSNEVQVPRYARDDNDGMVGLGPLAYARGSEGRAVDGCAPERLLAVHRTLAGNFASRVGWPAPMEVHVVDNCGGAVSNATVVASFSNGDPPLVLASLRNGLYVGTWRPSTAGGQVM